MKKYISIILLFVACAVQAQSVKDIFLQTPMEVFPLLSQQDRTALIRYAELGEMRAVCTVFGDTVEVAQIDYNLLILKVKDDAEYTWFVKDDNTNSTYFIETLCAPMCHSNVSFYLNGWNGLQSTVTPTAGEYANALFVRADIMDGQLVFTDETYKYLDETEISIPD